MEYFNKHQWKVTKISDNTKIDSIEERRKILSEIRRLSEEMRDAVSKLVKESN